MSDKKSLPPDWVVKLSRTRRCGKTYYFNTKTSESSWEFPKEGNVRAHRRKISESDTSDVLKSPSSHKENSHKRKKPLISNSETSSVHSQQSKHIIKHRKPSKSVCSKPDRNEEEKDEVTMVGNLTALAQIAKKAESSTLKDLPNQGSKGREVRVAEWISTVNQNFEPSEQGTVKSESYLSSPEADFGSVIENYVHNARIGLDVLGPRKTTWEDYIPLFPEDNHKNLSKASEVYLKPKEEPCIKRYSSPLSNTTANGKFSNSTTSSSKNTMVLQPNPTQSSTLQNFSFRSTTPSPQATAADTSPRFCRPCSASPPASYGAFSNSSSTLSRNTMIPNSSGTHTSTLQEFSVRPTTPTYHSSFADTNVGFFRPRSASPPDQPISRVSSGTNVPMVVDSSPVVNFAQVNRSTGGMLNSSGTSIPQKSAFSAVTPSNGTATPGCVSVDSGCVSFSEEAVGMEVDYSDELEEHIRQELQMVRSEFVIDAVKVQETAIQSQDLITRQSYTDTLYIVLDTNVLLSHLKFVSELKDYPVEGTGRPVLVVPWIVLQELDSLKSDAWKIRQGKIITPQNKNGAIGVDSLARQAIKFLHTCFENKHPRVRGQTLAEE